MIHKFRSNERRRSVWRPPTILISAAMLTMGAVLMGILAMPATATDHAYAQRLNSGLAGCTDGSREQAAEYAAAGRWYNPVEPVAWTEQPPVGPIANTLYFKVALRSVPGLRCVWALVTGDWDTQVYIDRSSDGGLTWAGGSRLGNRSVRLGQETTYTGVFDDSFPYVARACAVSPDANESYYCTGWF